MKTVRVLLLGDLVGEPGCAVFQKHIGRLRSELKIDAVIVNGENSADGKGITPRIMNFFKHNGVDVVTTGNHIWQKRCYSLSCREKRSFKARQFPEYVSGYGGNYFYLQRYGNRSY